MLKKNNGASKHEDRPEGKVNSSAKNMQFDKKARNTGFKILLK